MQREKEEKERKEAEENAYSDDKPDDVRHDDKVGVLEEESFDQVRLPFNLNFRLSANINFSTCNFVSSLIKNEVSKVAIDALWLVT